MTDQDTSSADPQSLFAFAEVGLRMDAQLEAGAMQLANALAEFAATCTEYPSGIDSGLANELRTLAQRNTQLDLWVRSVAEGFVQADTRIVEQVALAADGTPSADSPDGWDPILPLSVVPNAGDPYAVEIALEREQVQQFLSQVDGIDLTNRQGDPWNIALSGLKFVLAAVGDTPASCNDAFARVALAAPKGPDAVREALAGSQYECTQSRALVRLTGFLADGTPVDFSQEMALDQFSIQMTAAADGLAAGGSNPRSR